MRRVILVILSVGLLLTTYTVVPSKIYAANTTKSKNTLINAWRVTTRGHIYTPVNLNTKVMIRYTNQGDKK